MTWLDRVIGLIAVAGLVLFAVMGWREVRRGRAARWYRARLAALPSIPPAPSPPVCGLCGYRTGGGFWTPIPHHWGAVMHTQGCGPMFHEEEQVSRPTHVRMADGTYRALQPSGDAHG